MPAFDRGSAAVEDDGDDSFGVRRPLALAKTNRASWGCGSRLERAYGSSLSPCGVNGLLPGVEVPGVLYPDPGPPADPEGLTSLDGGNESPLGPSAEADDFLGPTTLGNSTTDDGRGDWLGTSFGDLGTTSDCGLCSLPWTASIEVGGVSCWGGET